MAEQLRADPDDLLGLAAAGLAAAEALGSHYRAGLRDVTLPPGIFGNLGASAGAASASADLQRLAEQALQAHVQVLEDDADGLIQAAFAYRAADRWADQRVGGSRRSPL
jgi:hypothetical protein